MGFAAQFTWISVYFKPPVKLNLPWWELLAAFIFTRKLFGDLVPAGPKAAPAAFGPAPEVITAM